MLDAGLFTILTPCPPRRQSGPRRGEGVKKCWDSQPAAESSLGTGTGTQDGSTFGGPTGKNPAVFVARTRFAWLPVPIRASRTPLVTAPDFFTPSSPRASRKSLIKRPVRGTVPGFFTHPDGSRLCPVLDATSLRGSYPVQAAENSHTRGPSDSPQRATRLAKNHNASEANLAPYSARKSRLAGSKDGLAVG